MDSTIRHALDKLIESKKGLIAWLGREDVPEGIKQKLRLQLEAGEAIIQIAREYIKAINN